MMKNLATIEVGDSVFWCFVKEIETKSEALLLQQALKSSYPEAAHYPLAWTFSDVSICGDNDGFDEDGEPPNSVGMNILNELKIWREKTSSNGMAICVVRFFGHKLLGVTCGRLPQCYEATCRLALHRFLNFGQDVPLIKEYFKHDNNRSLYGLCAGDTELILNVLPCSYIDSKEPDYLNKIIQELQFEAFKGSKKENLPRLQNLQADISKGIIPIYRYPGNYNGDEWETFDWSPTSLVIKEAVEKSLLPLTDQKMNHCVTNYYRNGEDFIAHHSDKDLDLNKNGVIVSLSLGEERIMELRRRAPPNDTFRVLLPHGSMLVMGPLTNKYFTHSIIKKIDSSKPRISLTFRQVTTFMEEKSGLCFGEGVGLKSIEECQKSRRIEDSIFLFGFGSLFMLVETKKKNSLFDKQFFMVWASIFAFSSYTYRSIRKAIRKRHEEYLARAFFSKSSLSGTKY